jgi:hypothetical protein
MHAIHRLLPAFLVAVLTCVPPCLAAQEEVEIPAAPADVELTESKVEALSKELKQLESLTKVLKELGSPAQKQPGEDAKAHLERVDVTMKARGMAIHLIHQQLERALDAKFQLAAQIDDYEQWIRKLEAGLPEFKEKYQKRAGDLETQVLELQRDGMVLASLLYDAALAAGDQAAAERYKVEFMLEGGVNLLDSVPDAAARRAKFSGKDRGNLEAEYRGIEDQVVDLDFERRLLATHAILETEALAGLLPQEHREMLKAAQDALAASKDLEDRSAQISIIARYVFDNLQLVNRYPDALRRSFVLQTKVVPELPKIEEAVDSLIGGQLPLGGRRGIMRPTAVSPNDIYRAPPK